jgi:protein SCO1/2
MAKSTRFVAGMLLVSLLIAACSNDDSAGARSAATPSPSYPENLLGVLTEPPVAISDIAVPSTRDTDFAVSAYRGKVVLIYFGYTSCPDVCPLTLAELRRAYLEMGEPADRLAVVFVTIDPERDTPDRMKRYVESFHSDFIGVYAQGDLLQQLMDQFGVVAFRRDTPDSAMGYLMDHTASVFVVDPQGQWVERWLLNTSASTMIHDLNLIYAQTASGGGSAG